MLYVSSSCLSLSLAGMLVLIDSVLTQDTSLLPPLLDFDYAFNDALRPELAALRPYAKPMYPHWRERREQRGGKRIMPQLDVREPFLLLAGFKACPTLVA